MSATWAACRFLTCSVLPVRLACQCDCPFCFSRSSVSTLEADVAPWSEADLRAHYRWSAGRGATRLVVTGGGEPLLRPAESVRAIRIGAEVFDEIALFTNGARLDSTLAGELRSAGLSYLCWSRHEITDADNRTIMGPAAPDGAAVLEAADSAGLPVRATCVMSTAGIHDGAGVWRYIDAFRDRGVSQFTFKHTYVARERSVFTSSPANAWSRDHQIDADPFGDDGEVIATLPWGPTIRRFGEVQACHYFEPTPQWELQHRLARSSNLLSDGSVYASLEDQSSLLHRLGCSTTELPSPRSMASTSAG
jgi:cyclic pyranopterin phosphate synthase